MLIIHDVWPFILTVCFPQPAESDSLNHSCLEEKKTMAMVLVTINAQINEVGERVGVFVRKTSFL